MVHTICGAAVDWDATGSMLQGWGSLLTIPALVWVANKGRQSFKDYSAQKRSEKHIEAAERILTAAYKARLAIEGVRSPLMEAIEIEAAERKISENGEDLSSVDPKRLKRAATTQLFYTRLSAITGEINAVWDAMPIALAYFGEDAQKALSNIAHQRRVVQVAADSYLEEDGTDKKFSTSICRDLYRGMGKFAADDLVATRVQESVELLEREFLPILRPDRQDR